MRILFISSDNYDDSEMLYPYYRLIEEGFEVSIASMNKGKIIGKHGMEINVDLEIDEVDVNDYDGLLLPGGTAPEKLRQQEKPVEVVRLFAKQKKPIASICHGQQLLISAKALNGKKATCYPGIKDDLVNAGAIYIDEPAVVCENLVTSRRPQDLPYFMREYIKVLKANNGDN